MPFTPLHMGPGLLFKAVLRGSFSLMIFGWSQIVMDLQPLLVILTGQGHLHGITHTYIGASVLALVSALSGKYLAELGMKLTRQACPVSVGWLTALCSAAIGTYSHIVLDSVMHVDIEPFWPWSSSNQLHGLVDIDTLNWACIGSGLMGAVLYYGLPMSGRVRSR